LDVKGKELMEVYIVDVPEDIQKVANGPLQGTENSMPAPPLGANCRRLTHTEKNKYPGLSIEPRFWLRSSNNGDKIFFLARDDNGINQVYYVSPYGGKINQITHQSTNVMSTVSISSDDKTICYLCDGSVFISELKTNKSFRVTGKSDMPLSNPIWSHNGLSICFCMIVSGKNQIFITDLEKKHE
jgi:Tol biopolymer transport system component